MTARGTTPTRAAGARGDPGTVAAGPGAPAGAADATTLDRVVVEATRTLFERGLLVVEPSGPSVDLGPLLDVLASIWACGNEFADALAQRYFTHLDARSRATLSL